MIPDFSPNAQGLENVERLQKGAFRKSIQKMGSSLISGWNEEEATLF